MTSETKAKGVRLVERSSSLCDLSVMYEGSREEIVAKPPNVGTRGMFINTAQNLPEGAVLNIRFRLAHSGVGINARAEVRYCLPGVGVGAEFVEISNEAVRAIENEIEWANTRGLHQSAPTRPPEESHAADDKQKRDTAKT